MTTSGVSGDEDAPGDRSSEFLVIYYDGRFDSLFCVSAGDAYSTVLGAVLAATRATFAITKGTADALSAAAGTSGCGSAGSTAIRLACGNRNIAVEKMENFGAAIGCGDAYVRNAFSDADGAGEPNGRGAADTDDTVSILYPLDRVVDQLGSNIDDGGIEDVRVEVGDEGLNMAGCGHA